MNVVNAEGGCRQRVFIQFPPPNRTAILRPYPLRTLEAGKMRILF